MAVGLKHERSHKGSLLLLRHGTETSMSSLESLITFILNSAATRQSVEFLDVCFVNEHRSSWRMVKSKKGLIGLHVNLIHISFIFSVSIICVLVITAYV